VLNPISESSLYGNLEDSPHVWTSHQREGHPLLMVAHFVYDDGMFLSTVGAQLPQGGSVGDLIIRPELKSPGDILDNKIRLELTFAQ